MEKSIRPFMVILIVLLSIVISSGATYLFVENESSKEESNLQSQINSLESQLYILKNSSTTVDETADWKTYESDVIKYSFKYPKEWGNASSTNGKVKVETGYSYLITFANTSRDVIAGYANTDFSAGRSGYMYENINLLNNSSKFKDCASFIELSGIGTEANGFKSCKDIKVNNKTIGIVVTNLFSSGEFQGPHTYGYYFTGLIDFPTVGFEITNSQESTQKEVENIIKSFKSAK